MPTNDPPEPKLNARSFERVCVLAGRQEYQPCLENAACTSRIHGHMTGTRAAQLVGQELAEWVRVTWQWTSRKGKLREETRREPAIRLLRRRDWKARPSGETRAKVKVMQLV